MRGAAALSATLMELHPHGQLWKRSSQRPLEIRSMEKMMMMMIF